MEQWKDKQSHTSFTEPTADTAVTPTRAFLPFESYGYLQTSIWNPTM